MGMLNINQKQVEEVMKRMGIKQENIEASRVIIELENSRIVIENPSVARVTMQGKDSFQISGDIKEESKDSFNEEDVLMVMEKTKVSREKVLKSLEENKGDIAMAIMELKK